MLIVLVSSPCILKFFLQHRSHLLPACVQLSSVDNNYAGFFANGELNESVFIWLTWTSRSFFKSSSYQAIGNLYYQKSNFAPLPSSDLTVGLSERVRGGGAQGPVCALSGEHTHTQDLKNERDVHVNLMKTDSLSSPFAKNKHNTVLYSHCRGAEERRVADPCVEPYLFDVLDVFVSHVATVSITFSCPLETLPLSFLLFAARFSLCYAFVYVLHISVFAARFCNVLCCVVKLMKMFSYFACVLTTCMCFLKLLCVELSGPPYIRHILRCSDWL